MADQLLAGAAKIEITPPAGTPLAGAVKPRASIGIEDPLFVKTLVIESGDSRIAYVMFDLIALLREDGDVGVRLAHERTGIPEDHIVWAASHTHTGPYTCPLLSGDIDCIDREWLAGIPEKMAVCVAEADAAKVPVKMSRSRAYAMGIGENRRFRFKDGRELNSWLLGKGEADIQCLGSAAPIDPEVGILSFEDENEELVAVLYQYTLHTNTNFGPRFSADYPAVVAARIKEEFGEKVITLFAPGACADIDSISSSHTTVGTILADKIIGELKRREPYAGRVSVDAVKKEVLIDFRELNADHEARLRDSQWENEAKNLFRQEVEIMQKEGTTHTMSVLQACYIGETAFVSLPGELFVEWGMQIKARSPFPWTYPVELGGDYVGYLVTEQAWVAGGYESLVARSAKPTWQAAEMMVDEAVGMLNQLYGTYVDSS